MPDQPTTVCTGFARCEVNGKLVYASTERLQAQLHLRNMLFALKDHMIQANRFSNIDIKISSRPILAKDEPDPYMGLDPSLFEVATPEEEAEMAKYEKRNNDPLFNKYLGIHSGNLNDHTPEEIRMLRDHVQREYPDFKLHV